MEFHKVTRTVNKKQVVKKLPIVRIGGSTKIDDILIYLSTGKPKSLDTKSVNLGSLCHLYVYQKDLFYEVYNEETIEGDFHESVLGVAKDLRTYKENKEEFVKVSLPPSVMDFLKLVKEKYDKKEKDLVAYFETVHETKYTVKLVEQFLQLGKLHPTDYMALDIQGTPDVVYINEEGTHALVLDLKVTSSKSFNPSSYTHNMNHYSLLLFETYKELKGATLCLLAFHNDESGVQEGCMKVHSLNEIGYDGMTNLRDAVVFSKELLDNKQSIKDKANKRLIDLVEKCRSQYFEAPLHKRICGKDKDISYSKGTVYEDESGEVYTGSEFTVAIQQTGSAIAYLERHKEESADVLYNAYAIAKGLGITESDVEKYKRDDELYTQFIACLYLCKKRGYRCGSSYPDCYIASFQTGTKVLTIFPSYHYLTRKWIDSEDVELSFLYHTDKDHEGGKIEINMLSSPPTLKIASLSMKDQLLLTTYDSGVDYITLVIKDKETKSIKDLYTVKKLDFVKYSSGAWTTNTEAMVRKSVIKKYIAFTPHLKYKLEHVISIDDFING